MRSRIFWKRALVFGSPLACIGLFACYDAPVQTPIPKTTQETKVRVAQNTKDKVDLLFLIDNSPSMAPKQAELKARFPQLISILDSFGKDNPADYHIGVVTSDLGAGPYNINSGQCHPGGDGGKLQPKGAAADATCGALGNGVNFIQYNQKVKDSMGNPTSNLPPNEDLPTAFGCMASVGDRGCGFEQQLEAVYKALHDPIPENAGFLRDDALLVVVWVTDEDDDCSIDPSSDLFDPSAAGMMKYGALLSYRGSQYGVACDPPGSNQGPTMLLPYADSGGVLNSCAPATAAQGAKCFEISRYTSFFSQPKANGGVKIDPNDVILVGITAPEQPVQSVLANVKAPVGPYQLCPGPVDPSGSGCAVVLQHSCVSVTNSAFFGDPAVRIRSVINSVVNPMNKQNTSICDSSYQQALQGLGDIIVSSLKPGCLSSPIENPDTHPDCVVEDVSRNSDGTTSVSEIPWCGTNDPNAAANSSTKPCWYLKTDPLCPVVDAAFDGGATQQYGVSIIRPASGAPPNTTAQVSCATIAVSQ
ncbi:MAG TPA: hypothetical protein VFF06_14715 [Polyangia bacterium]|nr:hypothetical protein [Polyangia bacterium]